MPNLLPDQAHELLRETINTGLRHAGYQRTVDLRTDYQTITTGKGYERFLTRYVPREKSEEFDQRLLITHQNLSSTASPLLKKAGQISRVQDIKRGFNFTGTSDRDQKDLLEVLNDFGGEGSTLRGTLEDYLTQHYDEVSQYDPNAFILLDFGSFNADAGERARPYAVFFDCPNVLNFRFTRGSLDYLLVQMFIAYKDPDGYAMVATDLILYGGPFAIRYFESAEGRKDLPQVYETFEAESKTIYRTVQYVTGLKLVPAVRIGDKPDIETAGLTCVSQLFHSALDQFKELINLKSQNDIVSRKHGFPRQYERAPLCPGELDAATGFRKGCNEGKVPITGATCTECGGTGFEVHRSEQDTVRLAFPENADDSVFDLSKLTYTVKPELETIKAYDEKIAALEVKIYVTAYSTDQQIKAQGPAKTATEYVVSREDQNNTLLPIADQKSTIYKSLVRHAIAIMNVTGDIEILYEFPRDLKLSSLSELYVDLKAARDAGAPDFEVEQILDDIARKRYESDPTALARYFIKKQHVPYFAQTLDTFEYFDASGRIPPALAVLRANVDVVFGELEIEEPRFYDLPYSERDGLVMAKVGKLESQLPKAIQMRIGQEQ
ncbi:hypothetical protein [Spirosoma utsteinense]|uniref:hypothetical protein n=1 Tax=Spirosoma utsteinense TaxID=2585773 RepID=UPI0016475AD7|nr:hypothetical protein [Spirosoma utsteinense]MBC3785735.1 hypothetical protein [Spirosoma utsteinense]